MGFELKSIICAVAAAAILTCSTAQAATMATMSGVISVNRGSGYQTVSEPGSLNPGDVVLVSPGGLAQVTYSCGLTEIVAPGAVYTVGDDAQKCAQASPGNVPGTPLAGPENRAANGPNILLIGAGIAAGVGGFFLVINSINNDDKPASP